jgi:recombination protein RecT
MPAQRTQQQRGSRAVVAQTQQQQAPTQALVAVTREIDNRLAIVQASAAAGIDADRLKLVALTAFTRSPELMACEPVSVARAIVEAGQLGLEPTGLLGGAYLVPRGGKATLMVGYRGLVMLAKRSGEVQRVEARVVRERDAFEYGYGLEPWLTHVPSREPDPGDWVAAYAVIVYNHGERQFDVMTYAEIEAIRQRSSAGRSGPWVTDWPEMAKKTVLRRLLKLAPLTINVAAKLDELDPEVEEVSPRRSGQTRQAELRQQLQAQLEGEYGHAPEARQVGPGATTDATDAGAVGGQAHAPEEAGPPAQASRGAAEAQPEAGAARPVEAAPAPAVDPVVECGISHEGIGAGPCILPRGHEDEGQLEHQERGGTRWTMPRKR